ncbi:hypothetical protein SAMN04488066_101141 [Halorubrum aquaticum]|uniref:DUF7344 domain-containing protein n=1 Tax=Halorubrum aquaticum TaxID=387340 RepID=A0A1I2Z1M6_9EURY|nr:hypothetical protein [Halorubrum aquaticum]SFH31798.1 hypothetical protein SAMN04488066_101141 [Halorubrum aquaticum]
MAITDRYGGIPETEIHDLLRNERRRQAIKHLQDTVGTTTLRDLAETIAEHETGESPPPKNIRNSVYNSLHQTHLPKLDRRGIVEYESDRKTIRLTEDARSVDVYMEVVTPYGITWSEYYSMLGTLSLFVVLAALIGVPMVAAFEPILWVSLFLAAFAASLGYQLWRERWVYLNALFG